MSATQLPVAQATALHAVACLQHYEERVHRLVESWLDMDVYQSVSAEVDAVKSSCALLPGLSVPIADLLVTHAELVHCLWRASQPDRTAGTDDCEAYLREHLASIHALSRKCLRVAGVSTKPL